MKRRIALIISVVLCMTMFITACSNDGSDGKVAGSDWEPIPEESIEPEATPEPEPEPTPEVVEGCYRSELTNEWIPEELKDQRPIAVMVDNEKTALPHYGVNDCDIVYEMMNSTLNNRITRLMCIAKDYENIPRLGSVRSTRPTNFMVMGEYDAILLHDGGPFYNDQYYAKDYVDHLSGGFARIKNGKSSEFTEYITPEEYTNTDNKTYDGLLKRLEDAKISRTYTSNYEGPHFSFSDEDYVMSLTMSTTSAKSVELPFPHNESKLKYNEETGTYDYYVYGNAHEDAETGEITSFKNVIIQGVEHCQLDENGYLIYNVIGSDDKGYFLTNGEAVPITWIKTTENGITQFINSNTGKDIVLNTGKTYIAIVPTDSWKKLVIE